jgi:hypothetical protein
MKTMTFFSLCLTLVAITPAQAQQSEGVDPNADVFAAADKNLTAEEKRNLEAIKGWSEAWKNDPGRMVDDFYSDSPEIYAPVQGLYWARPGQGNGKQAWKTMELEDRKLEEQIHPGIDMGMKFRTILLRGNTAAILSEGQSAIFLEFDENGKIDRDRSFFPGFTLSQMLADPGLLTSGTRVPGGRTPEYQAALQEVAELNQ